MRMSNPTGRSAYSETEAVLPFGFGHTSSRVEPAHAGAEVQARAARRMRSGKALVIAGFAVAVMGVIAYCVVCFTAGMNQEVGAALLAAPGWLIAPALGLIGLGTLMWLVGSFLYLIGGMDADSGEDLYF